MFNTLLNTFFGCSHLKTSFPLTPRRKLGNKDGRTETYVVCLECGGEFAYDWNEMQILKPVNLLILTRAHEKQRDPTKSELFRQIGADRAK